MRTKIGKRIGPVPIAAVAALALAAFLSAGLLLAPGSAQPAAADDDADCTITITKSGEATATINAGATDTACDAVGDTATVEFVGDADGTADQTMSVLIEEKGGPITAYPAGTEWDNNQLEPSGQDVAATSAKYRFVSVTIPKAAQNDKGVVEGQKATITVKGNVYIWIGTTSVTTAITDIPSGNAASGARAVAASPHTSLAITFLGAPALGKDGADFNSKLEDDTTLEQCVIANSTNPKEVGRRGHGL